MKPNFDDLGLIFQPVNDEQTHTLYVMTLPFGIFPPANADDVVKVEFFDPADCEAYYDAAIDEGIKFIGTYNIDD